MKPNPAAALCVLLSPLVACIEPQEVCEEDIRAQVLDEAVEVSVDAHTFMAELADDPVERDRGWRHRTCAREALLLVPDTPASELPVWGCALVEPIDALFLAGGEVIALERVEPCADEDCGGCALYGEGLAIDAVLELPLDASAGLAVGAPVSWQAI